MHMFGVVCVVMAVAYGCRFWLSLMLMCWVSGVGFSVGFVASLARTEPKPDQNTHPDQSKQSQVRMNQSVLTVI
jgi:hypothetical protein